MSVQEAVQMDERLQERAVGLPDGVHDQRSQTGSITAYLCPWLVVSQGGKVIVECKSREEARREWRRLKAC